MKIKLCVSLLSAFLLLCGLSAFAQDQTINGNLNLQCATPPCSTYYSYQIDGRKVLQIYPIPGGGSNLYLGRNAGDRSNNSTYPNTFLGNFAGNYTTSGLANTAVGYGAGGNNTTGNYNTFIGFQAGGGYAFVTNVGQHPAGNGYQNTFAGYYAGYNNTKGTGNVFIGYYGGYNNKEGNNNIYLRNDGPSTDESGAIRIGNSYYQTAVYFAGIAGKTTSGGAPVFVDTTGKLGTTGGSIAFEQMNDTLLNSQLAGTYSNLLALLNPNNVFYGDGSHLTGIGGGNYIKNQTDQQTSANFNIDGTGKTNYFNAGSRYQIGGADVLGIGDYSSVFLGENANFSGSHNIFLGYQAGAYTYAPDSNIYIGSKGCDNYGCNETNTIRIGTNSQYDREQLTVYMAPILGYGYSGGYVTIDSYGKLGVSGNAPEEATIKAQQQQIEGLTQQITDLQQRVARLEALIGKK
jgi:hypothetical protein